MAVCCSKACFYCLTKLKYKYVQVADLQWMLEKYPPYQKQFPFLFHKIKIPHIVRSPYINLTKRKCISVTSKLSY